MRRIAMVTLAGLVAAFGAACMNEDAGDRRQAAFEKSNAMKLALTVIGGDPKGLVGSGYVRQEEVNWAERAGGTSGLECASAAPPGRTCTWEYEKTCPPLTGNCATILLKAYPPAGARVVWTGCYLVGDGIAFKEGCHARLVLGQKNVAATFEHS